MTEEALPEQINVGIRHTPVSDLSSEYVSVSLIGTSQQVLLMEIDKPHRRNAFDYDLAVCVDRAMDFLDSGPSLRVGILMGANGYFSAGSDLAPGPRAVGTNGGEYGFLRRHRTRPLIAAVNGYALGGGFEMALTCDMVVAEEDAVLGFPEVLRGTVAACGGLFRADVRLPQNVATELLLTGKPMNGRRAHELGLVNRIAPTGELLSTALALAEDVSLGSPASIAAAMRARFTARQAEETRAWELTAIAREEVRNSPDWDEGIVAFFEKRPPRWAQHTVAAN